MIRTRLTDAFALAHPIVCAPMALVSGGALAGAVSRAGGLGLLGGGYAGTLGNEPDFAAEHARAEGAGIGVGFITWALDRRPHVLDLALECKPRCLFLSFGDPTPHARKALSAGVPVICQVQSLAQVECALAAGASAIVAQGTEAGGHGAARSTIAFVPEMADHLSRRAPDTLLLAAGGIADGRGLAAALMLGADGVVVGSRFWATREALTPQPSVERAIAATGDDTVRTAAVDAVRGVPWPAPFSFRVLRNRLTDEWAGREAEAQGAAFGSLAAEYDAARSAGDLDVAVTVVGEAAGLISDRPPAADVVDRIAREAQALLKDAPARLS